MNKIKRNSSNFGILKLRDDLSENKQEIQRTQQLISRGHVDKMLSRSQDSWDNFIYNKKEKLKPSTKHSDEELSKESPIIYV